jgi:hypothetical protein
MSVKLKATTVWKDGHQGQQMQEVQKMRFKEILWILKGAYDYTKDERTKTLHDQVEKFVRDVAKDDWVILNKEEVEDPYADLFGESEKTQSDNGSSGKKPKAKKEVKRETADS